MSSPILYPVAIVHDALVKEAEYLGWPRAYERDLHWHDWAFIRDQQPEMFIWIARPLGTHIMEREATGAIDAVRRSDGNRNVVYACLVDPYQRFGKPGLAMVCIDLATAMKWGRMDEAEARHAFRTGRLYALSAGYPDPAYVRY